MCLPRVMQYCETRNARSITGTLSVSISPSLQSQTNTPMMTTPTQQAFWMSFPSRCATLWPKVMTSCEANLDRLPAEDSWNQPDRQLRQFVADTTQQVANDVESGLIRGDGPRIFDDCARDAKYGEYDHPAPES
jgi:hypothetical protein